MKKMRYLEASSSLHSNASRTNEFEDPCKELWRKHRALRVLKFQDRFHHRSKTNITLLFGVRFRQIQTRWKGNFVHYAMESSLDILSVMDIKEKFME
jgi:hypothetical protein